jgi:murein L,D-transpeptidase YcbB/YkuD
MCGALDAGLARANGALAEAANDKNEPVGAPEVMVKRVTAGMNVATAIRSARFVDKQPKLKTLSAKTLMVAALMVSALPSARPAHAQLLAGIDSWLRFDNGGSSGDDAAKNSGDWDQQFDQSDAKQLEIEQPKGYPTISKDNLAPMKVAIKHYADIALKGGWEQVPSVELRLGVAHPAVVALRRRLEVSGDLRPSGGERDIFDSYVEKAVKQVQVSNGLPPTGVVDKQLIIALNVPAAARLRQLRTNLARIASLNAPTSGKYVIVNIPAAQIEAVDNNQVISRHIGVVGKINRQTPILASKIQEINFNKVWVVPPTVLKSDLIPKGREAMAKGQNVLDRYKVDAYVDYNAYSRGQKIDPMKIDWNSNEVQKYFFAQQPGEDNPLGFVKINFPSPHQVYMHDTPGNYQSLFAREVRTESSGCVRVQNVQTLVAWLLAENGWDRTRVAHMKQTRETMNVTLKKPVPLHFNYISAWATPDGMTHFRRDLYHRDGTGVTASAD